MTYITTSQNLAQRGTWGDVRDAAMLIQHINYCITYIITSISFNCTSEGMLSNAELSVLGSP